MVARFPLLIELGADDEPGLTAAIERLGNVPGVQAMKVGTTDTKKADAPAT